MRSRRAPLYALFLADAVSLVGNVVALVAIPWFVLQETGSAALTGVTAAVTSAPVVIAAFFGGALVDRLGPRLMSVASDLASAVCVAAIPALHVTVGIDLWQLLVLVFLGALFDAPGATARRALLPDLAEDGGMRLERATSFSQAIQRGSVLVGAPLGGALVAGFGVTTALWIDAASFLVSALLVARTAPARAVGEPGERPSYASDLLEGLRFIARDRLIRAVVLTVMVTNFLDAPLTVLLAVYADREFGSAVHLGTMLGVFGGAAVVGSLFFAAVGHRLPRRLTFAVCFLAWATTYLALATTPPLVPALALLTFGGLAVGPLNPVLGTVSYERVPASMRGRVLGVGTAGAWLMIPLGALVGGIVVEAAGLEWTLLAVGLCYTATTAYGLVNPAFREMDRRRQPSALAGAPAQELPTSAAGTRSADDRREAATERRA